MFTSIRQGCETPFDRIFSKRAMSRANLGAGCASEVLEVVGKGMGGDIGAVIADEVAEVALAFQGGLGSGVEDLMEGADGAAEAAGVAREDNGPTALCNLHAGVSEIHGVGVSPIIIIPFSWARVANLAKRVFAFPWRPARSYTSGSRLTNAAANNDRSA